MMGCSRSVAAPHRGAWWLGAAGLALAAPPVHAFGLEPRAQAQLTVLGGMSLPDPGFGVVEVQVNGSIWSLGAALGLAFDRFPIKDGDTAASGGEFHAALQWRFLALVEGSLYEYLDPHIDLGLVLGGGRAVDTSWFRGAGYAGLGIDVGLSTGDDGAHPVFTIQYRWSPTGLHAPDAAPDHLLLFGMGVRVADI